jgi:hypothetical protein
LVVFYADFSLVDEVNHSHQICIGYVLENNDWMLAWVSLEFYLNLSIVEHFARFYSYLENIFEVITTS